MPMKHSIYNIEKLLTMKNHDTIFLNGRWYFSEWSMVDFPFQLTDDVSEKYLDGFFTDT